MDFFFAFSWGISNSIHFIVFKHFHRKNNWKAHIFCVDKQHTWKRNLMIAVAKKETLQRSPKGIIQVYHRQPHSTKM